MLEIILDLQLDIFDTIKIEKRLMMKLKKM